MDDCAEVEVLEEVTEVAASKKAHATEARPLAVQRAGVKDVIVPVVAEGGGEAAQAQKKRREPVAVFAERASVGAVGASSRAFAGGEVKRTLRNRSALDVHGGGGSARTADAEIVGESGEGDSAFEPVDAAPPLVASDRGQVPRELVLQVARVLADFRDYADTYFRRLMDILGQDQE